MARSDWHRPDEFSAPEGRRRVALEISYDGRSFFGWQSQEEGQSVQQTVLEAAERLTGQTGIEVVGSGRTDSGVHAKGQVAHIEMDDCSIPEAAFCNGLNSFLPSSVRVNKAWNVDRSFHARYSAMAREYRYFIREGYGRDCFADGLITTYRRFPDLDLLNSYASALVGTHDFTTFTSARDICPSKVRDIYEAGFSFTESTYGEKLLCFRIVGNAFLYHMVRSLVGTMMEFALKGRTFADFEKALDSCDRQRAGKTALSDGLYLWRVSYDPEEYRWFEEKYGKQGK